MLDQMDLDIYETFYLTAAEYTFFSKYTRAILQPVQPQNKS